MQVAKPNQSKHDQCRLPQSSQGPLFVSDDGVWGCIDKDAVSASIRIDKNRGAPGDLAEGIVGRRMRKDPPSGIVYCILCRASYTGEIGGTRSSFGRMVGDVNEVVYFAAIKAWHQLGGDDASHLHLCETHSITTFRNDIDAQSSTQH